MTASVTAPFRSARRRLNAADRLLVDPELMGDDGVWPRACTWLIRLAIENALDEFWLRREPAVAEANRRGQILALTGVVDERLGREYGELWATLSRAAHHHAYELAPTSAELRRWLDDATAVVSRLATVSDAADRGRDGDG